jgi:hypothetical protein
MQSAAMPHLRHVHHSADNTQAELVADVSQTELCTDKT